MSAIEENAYRAQRELALQTARTILAIGSVLFMREMNEEYKQTSQVRTLGDELLRLRKLLKYE